MTVTLSAPISSYSDTVSIKIFDLAGRQQLQIPLTANTTTFSVQDLPQGVYLYEIQIPQQGVYSGKLVKQF